MTRLEKEIAARAPAPKLVGLALDAGSTVSGKPLAAVTLPRLARVPPSVKPAAIPDESAIMRELAAIRRELVLIHAELARLAGSPPGSSDPSESAQSKAC
jgi:hypothetical protein